MQIESIYAKQAEQQLKDVQALLEQNHKKITEMSKLSIDLFGGKTASNPQGLKDTVTQIENLNKKNKELTAVEKERIKIQKQLEVTQAKITVSTEQNTIALNTQKSILKATAGSYAELNEKLKRAEKAYLDIMIRGKQASQTQYQYNKELSKAKKEFQSLNKEILKADNAVGRWNRTKNRAVSLGRELLGVLGLTGLITVLAGIISNVYQLTKEFDGLNRALKLVSNSTEIFTQNQAFLRSTSRDFGTDLKILTKQFTQFYVSAKDKISSTQIQSIFRSVSKAASVMGLSVQQQERAFLALNQMMSKGTIQAEELRGQLGEALPGALGIMAKAVGVSEKRLMEMMKAGELSSAVLVDFAKQLEKTFGIENIDRIESLASAQTRLASSWQKYVDTVSSGEGNTSKILISIFNNLSDILEMAERIDQFGLWEAVFGSKRGQKTDSQAIQGAMDEIQAGLEDTELSYLDYYKNRKTQNKGIIEDLRKTITEESFILQASKKQRNELTKEEYDAIKNLTGKRLSSLKENIDFNKRQLNQAIEVNNILVSKIDEEINHRNKLIKTHIELNKIKNKGVKEDILLDVAKSKTNEVLQKEIDFMSKKTNEIKENTKSLKEQEKYIIGTESWYQKQIKTLSETRVKTANNREEYERITKIIKHYEEGLRALRGEMEKGNDIELNAEIYSQAFFDTQISNLESRIKLINKENEAYADLNAQLEMWKDMQKAMYGESAKTEESVKELDTTIKNFLKTFETSFIDSTGFSKMFQLLTEDLEKYKGDALATALAVSDAFQQAFNTISNASQQNFEAEYSRNEQRYQTALLFANGNAEAEAELAREKERRDKEIARREMKAKKQMALFNIAIDGAQAVLAVIARKGKLWEGLAVGALTLTQLAVVNSQQIPEFWKGTDDAPEGWAKTDEKGAELHLDKNNRVKDVGSNKGARYKYLSKGDKIIPAEKTKDILNLAKFNQEYGNIMMNNGIMPASIVNNKFDVSDLRNDIKNLTNVVANKSEFSIVDDENGRRYFEKRRNETKELKNSVIRYNRRNARA